jgi:hypothetical protein
LREEIPSPAEDASTESKAGRKECKENLFAEWEQKRNQKRKPSPALSQETKGKAEKIERRERSKWQLSLQKSMEAKESIRSQEMFRQKIKSADILGEVWLLWSRSGSFRNKSKQEDKDTDESPWSKPAEGKIIIATQRNKLEIMLSCVAERGKLPNKGPNTVEIDRMATEETESNCCKECNKTARGRRQGIKIKTLWIFNGF